MAEMLIQSENLVAIADKIRVLSGTEDAMGLDDMANTLNTENTNFESNLSTQDDLIAQIQTALQNKASASEPVLQTKTVTPTTSSQDVTPDSGYDGLSKVTVNAMPTATQATPSISVNSSGLITASATQSAGYVTAGTKSGTKQLTTQAAKTVTPSTSSQTVVASGVYTTGAVTVGAIPSTYVKPTTTKSATTYTPTTSNQTIAAGTYCSGAQTIKGDANLKAENIAEGVSIFGVTGTHSGGGGSAVETCMVTLNFASSGNPRNVWISGTQLVDGSITALSVIDYDGSNSSGVTSPYTLTDIIKNSALAISSDGAFSLGSVTCEGCELLYKATSPKTVSCKITESIASITIMNDY